MLAYSGMTRDNVSYRKLTLKKVKKIPMSCEANAWSALWSLIWLRKQMA